MSISDVVDLVHYKAVNIEDRKLRSLCGAKWEWITDIPKKVTCPKCLSWMKEAKIERL